MLKFKVFNMNDFIKLIRLNATSAHLIEAEFPAFWYFCTVLYKCHG